MDCEMCETTAGTELTRVTLVAGDYSIIYDELVMPPNKILDYNTKYSGITEETLEGVTKTLEEARSEIFRFLSKETIIVGHSLENDLHALKVVHWRVIDSAVAYMVRPKKPKRPYKLSLKKLSKQYLDLEIQNSALGHDSAEDALASLKLIQRKLGLLKKPKPKPSETKKQDLVEKSKSALSTDEKSSTKTQNLSQNTSQNTSQNQNEEVKRDSPQSKEPQNATQPELSVAQKSNSQENVKLSSEKMDSRNIIPLLGGLQNVQSVAPPSINSNPTTLLQNSLTLNLNITQPPQKQQESQNKTTSTSTQNYMPSITSTSDMTSHSTDPNPNSNTSSGSGILQFGKSSFFSVLQNDEESESEGTESSGSYSDSSEDEEDLLLPPPVTDLPESPTKSSQKSSDAPENPSISSKSSLPLPSTQKSEVKSSDSDDSDMELTIVSDREGSDGENETHDKSMPLKNGVKAQNSAPGKNNKSPKKRKSNTPKKSKTKSKKSKKKSKKKKAKKKLKKRKKKEISPSKSNDGDTPKRKKKKAKIDSSKKSSSAMEKSSRKVENKLPTTSHKPKKLTFPKRPTRYSSASSDEEMVSPRTAKKRKLNFLIKKKKKSSNSTTKSKIHKSSKENVPQKDQQKQLRKTLPNASRKQPQNSRRNVQPKSSRKQDLKKYPHYRLDSTSRSRSPPPRSTKSGHKKVLKGNNEKSSSSGATQDCTILVKSLVESWIKEALSREFSSGRLTRGQTDEIFKKSLHKIITSQKRWSIEDANSLSQRRPRILSFVQKYVDSYKQIGN